MSSVEREKFNDWMRTRGVISSWHVQQDMWDAWNAALREQPEARGVVDDAIVERVARALAANDRPHRDPSEWWAGLDEEVRNIHRRRARVSITAAQQPVQEGGGERKGCGDPTCGCDWPSFTEPMKALRFLSGRMKYAGIAEGVARSYARGIDDILAKYDTTPPSAPVGVELDDLARVQDALRRIHAREPMPPSTGRASGGDPTARRPMTIADASAAAGTALLALEQFLSGLPQQPAQAAPGDADVRELLDAMDNGDDPRPAFIRLRKRYPPKATPPGDDAAGGGFDDPAYSFSANPYEEPRS